MACVGCDRAAGAERVAEVCVGGRAEGRGRRRDVDAGAHGRQSSWGTGRGVGGAGGAWRAYGAMGQQGRSERDGSGMGLRGAGGKARPAEKQWPGPFAPRKRERSASKMRAARRCCLRLRTAYTLAGIPGQCGGIRGLRVAGGDMMMYHDDMVRHDRYGRP